MSEYVLCDCCYRPVPITEDDIGLTVTCPRTGRMVPVRASSIRSTAPSSRPTAFATTTRPKTPIPAAKSPVLQPIAAQLSTLLSSPPIPTLAGSPPSPASACKRARKHGRLPIVAGLLGLLLLIGGSVFAARSLWPDRRRGDADTAKRPDPKSGTVEPAPVPPLGTETTTPPTSIVPNTPAVKLAGIGPEPPVARKSSPADPAPAPGVCTDRVISLPETPDTPAAAPQAADAAPPPRVRVDAITHPTGTPDTTSAAPVEPPDKIPMISSLVAPSTAPVDELPL